MQKRRTALVAAICTLVLICVFASTFLISSMSYQTDRYKVTLPSQTDSTDDLESNLMETQLSSEVELPDLTPENVQSVILSLPKSEQYTGSVTNTLYLSDGTASAWRAITYVKNNAQRVERYNAGETLPEIYLYYEDSVYAWEQGNATYWSASAGALTADMTAMIPSYRDVCTLPQEMISDAELLYTDGIPYIRVVCGAGDTEYMVSLISGLLEQVKYYENGAMVREVLIATSEEEIADSFFTLPGESEPIFTNQ